MENQETLALEVETRSREQGSRQPSFFSLSEASMVYILFEPIIYPFGLFSSGNGMHTIAFFALWPRRRATERVRAGAMVVVYTF